MTGDNDSDNVSKEKRAMDDKGTHGLDQAMAILEMAKKAASANGNGAGLVINPQKTNILVGVGTIFSAILMIVAIIGGVTIPIVWNLGDAVRAYQSQNYNYQVISVAYMQREDCKSNWMMRNRVPVLNYSGECDHITVPAVALLPPAR